MKFAIETDHLTKFYGKARGIENVCLQVEEGEIFGFIGPNGAGKSTTIRTLLGLISPSAGRALVLGLDVRERLPDILAEVGYLPSESAFYPGMRVRDVLRLSADLRKKDCREEAERLCRRLELDPARRTEELSFGNRKKVAIICALQHRPRLLILDEPTGGLDPLMQREFFSILHERNREGATVFLSSHILSEVEHNCGRAAVIRAGRLIACDRMQALSKTSARRVAIRGHIDVSHLAGVRDLEQSEAGASFLFSGETQDLIRCLSQGMVTDLSVTEPDLEEIFLHYYQEEGEAS